MKIRSRVGFTLVEFLVILTCISVMLACLLPALSKATDLVRRSVCANNLRQYRTGIVFYLNDFRGSLPPCYDGNGFYGWPTYNHLGMIAKTATRMTGNLVFYKYRYVANELMNCPAMDYKLKLVLPENIGSVAYGATNPNNGPYGYSYIHYDYRFNIEQETPAVFDAKAFSRANYASKALLWDQAESNRDAVGRVRKRSVHFSEGNWTGADITKLRKWAHQTGGTILRFDGSGVFYQNRVITDFPQTSDGICYLNCAWPGFAATYNIFLPGWRSTSTTGKYYGIDYWINTPAGTGNVGK